MTPEDPFLELDSTPLWNLADANVARSDRALPSEEDVQESNDQANAAGHAELQSRIVAWDQQIVNRLHSDVEPPAELKSQILTALADADSSAHQDMLARSDDIAQPKEIAQPTETARQEHLAAPADSQRVSRRLFNRWSVGVAAAVCLGLVALTLILVDWSPEVLQVEQIIRAVEQSLDQDPVFMEVAQQGEPVEGMGVPTQYLIEDSKGFRDLNLLGSHVVAHDLRLGTPVARLFVISTAREVKPDLVIGGPPVNPQKDTNGRCVGIWRSKDRQFVYVLIVHGDKDAYRRLVRHRAAA